MNKIKITFTIGNNIKALRDSLSLKQEAFASELNTFLKKEFNKRGNYDSKTISNWERGKSIPKMDVIIAIAKHYNLSLDELLKQPIENIIEQSIFANSEENLLKDLIKNKDVCLYNNGKYISSWNSKSYKYGQLSYLAENLIEYRGSLSKHFSITNNKKEVEIIIGILDINEDKRELHYLGNGENDIVSVENIPLNYSYCDINNNEIISSLYYDEMLNNNHAQLIKLGNGKSYIIDSVDNYDIEKLKFEDSNIPNDLSFYEINRDDDWTAYATLKGHYILNDDLFEFNASGAYYCQRAGVFAIVLWGNIKISDAQLIKILSDDYKHRLINTLSKLSDDNYYEFYKNQVNEYEKIKEQK